jgi:ABC-2 type transport system permease protein
MINLLTIARREFGAYFSSSLATVFLVVFLVATGALTFFVGNFFGIGQANLVPFFNFHPWLFLVLMPAIGMRLWAEERRSGTIEFLMTMPVTTWQAVGGKFLAAWAFALLALALTFPIWITVNYLGSPDNGVILASYAGSAMMGGAFLALACFVSALTRNQVTAFVVSVALGFVMLLSSQDAVLALFNGWAPTYFVDLIASFSFARHFDAITGGVLEASDVVFFLSFITLFLFLNCQILDMRRGS